MSLSVRWPNRKANEKKRLNMDDLTKQMRDMEAKYVKQYPISNTPVFDRTWLYPAISSGAGTIFTPNQLRVDLPVDEELRNAQCEADDCPKCGHDHALSPYCELCTVMGCQMMFTIEDGIGFWIDKQEFIKAKMVKANLWTTPIGYLYSET